MRLTAALMLPLLIAAAPATARAADTTTWRLDTTHTQIVFFADHLGLSNGIGRVRVREGWFRFDPDDWSNAQAEVVIDLTSVDMGDAKWSDAVRSGQFLDVTRWPTARFTASRLEKTGDVSGVLHGELVLRGKTQPVELAVTFNRIGRDPYAFRTKAGFTATTTLARGAFGMTRFADVVGENVSLRIEVEGIRDAKAEEKTTDGTEEQH